MMTTKHTHAPSFGRRFAGCPRCAELAQGALAVAWSGTRKREAASTHVLRAHDCYASRCGPVCTFGD